MAGLFVARPIMPPRTLNPALRQLVSFGVIGVVSTGAYVALYAALRPFTDATVANAIALVITAIGNTAANRRLTFAKRGRQGAIRDQAGGIVALVVALAITTSAVGILGLVAPSASRALELVVLVAANAVATACRFLLLRSWITPALRSTTRNGGAS